MALKQITESEFSRNPIDKHPAIIGMVEEKYWFADNEANIIGATLLDNIDKDWSYVVLALEDDGVYRFADGDVSFNSNDDAIEELTLKMKEISSAGKIEQHLYHSNLFDNSSKIIVTDINDEIKRFFKKYPERLYDINPRKFEELIASIFADLGFTVELTKATRDGGRDIIATIKNAVTNFLAYVECKRYSADNKIDVGIIREVIGVHYTEKPSKSIIVTTSFFTKDAKAAAKKIENQLELKDFNHIKEWLQQY